MKVFGYSRVSTLEQADDGASLAAQEQQITGYALMKGWPSPTVFFDRAVSGSVPLAERPEGQRLLAAAGKGDAIVTTKLDRAFRSASDALHVMEALKARGVSLHMIDLGGDVTGNGISKMVFTILAAVAEAERERIRERIKDAKRYLTSQGIFSGGKRPFGFAIVPTGEVKANGQEVCRLEPNAEEQAVVARMVAMRQDGATLQALGAMSGLDVRTVKRVLERAVRASGAPPPYEPPYDPDEAVEPEDRQ